MWELYKLNCINPLFRLPRRYKRFLQALTDGGLITFSFLMAMLLRLDGWSFFYEPMEWVILSAAVPVSLFIFTRLGFYNAVIRYMSSKMVEPLVLGVVASALSIALMSYLFNLSVPRSVPFIYAMLGMLSIGGVRFMLRGLYMSSYMRRKPRVLVYGAGAAGRQLAASLAQGHDYLPVAYLDDSVSLQGTFIQGLKVYPPTDVERLIQQHGAEKILLAMPSQNRARRREILMALESHGVPVQTIPGIADLVSGKAKINEIHDVAVEDLLGRDAAAPDPALMSAKITGKVVMVTGAGGSIGSELCRQIIRQAPKQLLLLELSEFGLYSIEQELNQLAETEGLNVSVRALLGSVQKGGRLETIMKSFKVQTIYHAAAYKHVPMVEHNIIEGVINNVFGTLRTAKAAIAAQVETFVLVSTDKAVRPTNVMGATKRMSELVCQALSDTQSTTVFAMVRFGNVLGSSGSVVPLFRRQIQEGGPITITHREITRYFMTIPEAAQLVIQAGSMAKGGDVFVLDMGEPVKIADLAKHLVRLSGLELVASDSAKTSSGCGDIELVYTGLRPGEKLYEELLIGDNVEPTFHKRIMTAREVYWSWARLEFLLDELVRACRAGNSEMIRQLLLKAPIAYQPQCENVDLIWQNMTAVKDTPKPLRAKPVVVDIELDEIELEDSLLAH